MATKRFIENCSLKDLSQHFGRSEDTVVSAYARLKKRGFAHRDISDALRSKLLRATSKRPVSTKSSRPALDRMMAAVERDEISSVVVYSFSRSTTHLLTALQIFKKKGVHFVSLTEKIDTNSAVGVAIYLILASVSQLEIDHSARVLKPRR